MRADDLNSQKLAVDLKSTQDLRLALKQNPQQGLRQAAQQFESMFLQMVLKSMRDATPQDGVFDSDATRFYTSMSDQQLAQRMASTGQLGFARLIEQQLGRYLNGGNAGNPLDSHSSPQTLQQGLRGVINNPAGGNLPTPAAVPGSPLPGGEASADFPELPPAVAAAAARVSGLLSGASGNNRLAVPAANVAATAVEGGGSNTAQAREFVNRVWPYAVEASQATGVPAHFLVAHAALESGWGRSEPRTADGRQSFNLFGVKAGRSWNGASVMTPTTEYIDGQPQSVQDRFRAYGSYAEAFRDYANLLNRPRFSGVLGQQNGTDFARSLQQAGYATDPMYADKLSRIINGATLRQALFG